jgi:hypothetical protein
VRERKAFCNVLRKASSTVEAASFPFGASIAAASAFYPKPRLLVLVFIARTGSILAGRLGRRLTSDAGSCGSDESIRSGAHEDHILAVHLLNSIGRHEQRLACDFQRESPRSLAFPAADG